MIQDNRYLLDTVDALTYRLSQYKEIEQENARLRALLNFKKASLPRLIAAGIIARDSSNFSDTIVISQGRKSKINPDTVVVAEAGLVGRVYESSSSMSRIMLITDPNSRVSAVVSRSRQIGVVYGTSSNLCELRYLPLASDILAGDEIVTSGFSDIYPKGILIGKVVKIVREPRGLSLLAVVAPAVNFTSLEEVLCIE
jgi:rod shape-determining protein MreC